MQQVPSPGDCAASESAPGAARWNRIPRVQLPRNKNDQRVPRYFDQTVPVWPLHQLVRRSNSSTSPRSARSSVGILGNDQYDQPHAGNGGRGFGVTKAARKFAGMSQKVRFRRFEGSLFMPLADAHALCNVSEILRECSCDRTTTDESLKWSGIEQDLFTCTAVDPKVFVVPSAADFISNKKSKSKGKSPSDH